MFQHIILFIKFALSFAIPHVPQWVATEMAKVEFQRRQSQKVSVIFIKIGLYFYFNPAHIIGIKCLAVNFKILYKKNIFPLNPRHSLVNGPEAVILILYFNFSRWSLQELVTTHLMFENDFRALDPKSLKVLIMHHQSHQIPSLRHHVDPLQHQHHHHH